LKKVLELLGIAAIVLLLGACSKGNGNQTPPANLRFINGATNQSLTVVLNGTVEFAGVAAESASAYTSIAAGTYTISVTDVSGTLVSPAVNFAFSGSQAYSLVAYVRNGAVITALIDDSQVTPPAGYGKLGVANISPDSGALDVYVVAPGTTDLSQSAPVFQSAVFRGSPVWTTLVAGTFDVVVTGAGNPSDVRLTLPSVPVANGQVLALAFMSTPGGSLVNAMLDSLNGPAQFVSNTNARVRIVSALPVNPATAVTGTIGTTTLSSVFAPNPGLYTLVAGGSSTYSIGVGAAQVASLPPATFAAGGDFTIIVYGTVATPSVAVYTDNNQIPVVGGDVKLRLVNAAVSGGTGLTLYVNNVQAASDVAYGAASPYFAVATSSSAQLELVEPSVPPVFPPTVQLSPSGSVYTVFVIDSTLTPYVIRDR